VILIVGFRGKLEGRAYHYTEYGHGNGNGNGARRRSLALSFAALLEPLQELRSMANGSSIRL
jgi:hypothetical protein